MLHYILYLYLFHLSWSVISSFSSISLPNIIISSHISRLSVPIFLFIHLLMFIVLRPYISLFFISNNLSSISYCLIVPISSSFNHLYYLYLILVILLIIPSAFPPSYIPNYCWRLFIHYLFNNFTLLQQYSFLVWFILTSISIYLSSLYHFLYLLSTTYDYYFNLDYPSIIVSQLSFILTLIIIITTLDSMFFNSYPIYLFCLHSNCNSHFLFSSNYILCQLILYWHSLRIQIVSINYYLSIFYLLFIYLIYIPYNNHPIPSTVFCRSNVIHLLLFT